MATDKIKIKSKKTGKESTVSNEVFSQMKELNGKHAYQVLKGSVMPPEVLEAEATAKATPAKKTGETK